jgi:outer membrane protein assembly factor BamB
MPSRLAPSGSRAALASLLAASPLLVLGFPPAIDAAPADGPAWPHWRGPAHTGISEEKGWKSDGAGGAPKILWKASVGAGFSSFSIAGGRAHTTGNSSDTDTVFAFDAETGKEVWKHSYPCPLEPKNYEGGTSATPTVADGKVYTLSKAGHIFCLDAASGKVVWQRNAQEDPGAKPPTWGFASSAYVEGNKVFFNVGSAGLALDKDTGKILWKSGNGPSGYSTPVPYTMGAQRGVALFLQKGVAGVDPESGKILWEHPWKTSYDAHIADPIVAGNQVFISSGYGTGCALLRIDGGKATEVWRNKNMRNHINSCVLWKEHIYGIDGNAGGNNPLACLDLKTGAVKWSKPGIGSGSLMLADGKLIVLGDKGTLIIAEASPTAYQELARAQILSGKCWTTPILCGGRIYARNAKGDVVCLDVKG